MGAGAVQAADAPGGEEVNIAAALLPTARSFIVRDLNVYTIQWLARRRAALDGQQQARRSTAPVLCGGRAISKAWDADLSHAGDGAAARWKNVA
jgi:hypothetical protein